MQNFWCCRFRYLLFMPIIFFIRLDISNHISPHITAHFLFTVLMTISLWDKNFPKFKLKPNQVGRSLSILIQSGPYQFRLEVFILQFVINSTFLKWSRLREEFSVVILSIWLTIFYCRINTTTCSTFKTGRVKQGGSETGSMYVLSYQVRWYVHI